MKKIKISISVNSIYFSFTNKECDKSINQTSYIETGNLMFDIQYFANNTKIISSFIKDITNDTKIETIKIKNLELVPLILKTIKNNSDIKKLYILDNKIVDTNSFLTIVDNKNLVYLNCYNMSNIMFNYLNERKKITIELRNENKNSSSFISDNKLSNYSAIYYKKYIIIDKSFTANDLKDFETFLIINKSLETINLFHYEKEMLKNICELLSQTKKKKITINISNQKLTNKDYIDIQQITKNKVKISYHKQNYLKILNFILPIFLFLLTLFLTIFIIAN